jgi:ethanolamine utilization protein EutM
VIEALGVLETTGVVPALAAIDTMEKTAMVRVLHCELNDACGVVVKIAGGVEAVEAAVAAGHRMAEQLQGQPVSLVIARPDASGWQGINSPPQYNPLIEQDVVFFHPRHPTN